MADQKITDLATLATGSVVGTDLVEVVDVSDTSMAASGTNKKLSVTDLIAAVKRLALSGWNMTFSSSPGGSQIENVDLNYTLDIGNPDLESVNVKVGGSLSRRLWRNEWGATRGTSPYTWGDAILRAIRSDSDGITTGTAIEVNDRRTGAPASIMWGVRWTDGQMVQANQVVGAVYKTTAATSDSTINALGLPNGTLIVNV